jgi:hypothetical protein
VPDRQGLGPFRYPFIQEEFTCDTEIVDHSGFRQC